MNNMGMNVMRWNYENEYGAEYDENTRMNLVKILGMNMMKILGMNMQRNKWLCTEVEPRPRQRCLFCFFHDDDDDYDDDDDDDDDDHVGDDDDNDDDDDESPIRRFAISLHKLCAVSMKIVQ